MSESSKFGLSKIAAQFTSSPTPLFGDREVHLHLGAHKTATTFIQDALKSNNPLLLAKGVLYLPLQEMRSKNADNGKGLTSRIIALSQANRQRGQIQELRQDVLEDFGPERLKKCHTVLISEENLSLYLSGYTNGRPFSDLSQRLMHLREEIGPKLKVFFSIRDYPDFISSVYVEILRHHQFLSFNDFLISLYQDLPNLWLDAYHNLVQLFGEENVTMWDFEDTVKNPQAILSMLTGGVQNLDISSKPSRQSLSQKAVEFIRDFSKLPGESVAAQALAKVANRLHPLSKMNSKFDPWTPREKRILREHYNNEKKSIRIKSFDS